MLQELPVNIIADCLLQKLPVNIIADCLLQGLPYSIIACDPLRRLPVNTIAGGLSGSGVFVDHLTYRFGSDVSFHRSERGSIKRTGSCSHPGCFRQ